MREREALTNLQVRPTPAPGCPAKLVSVLPGLRRAEQAPGKTGKSAPLQLPPTTSSLPPSRCCASCRAHSPTPAPVPPSHTHTGPARAAAARAGGAAGGAVHGAGQLPAQGDHRRRHARGQAAGDDDGAAGRRAAQPPGHTARAVHHPRGMRFRVWGRLLGAARAARTPAKPRPLPAPLCLPCLRRKGRIQPPLHVCPAARQARDIYQPFRLGKQLMESSALGADVGLSLIHLLGDTESVLRERNAQVGGARAARMRALSAVWLSVPGGSGCFKGVLLRGRIAAQRTALEHYAITRVPAFGLPPTPAEGRGRGWRWRCGRQPARAV